MENHTVELQVILDFMEIPIWPQPSLIFELFSFMIIC